MYEFLSGVVSLGCLIASGFFFRFWLRTSDRLFGWFAVSFLLLGCERFLLVLLHTSEITSPAVYLVRLLAFVFIIVAIFEKNKAGSGRAE